MCTSKCECVCSCCRTTLTNPVTSRILSSLLLLVGRASKVRQSSNPFLLVAAISVARRSAILSHSGSSNSTSSSAYSIPPQTSAADSAVKIWLANSPNGHESSPRPEKRKSPKLLSFQIPRKQLLLIPDAKQMTNLPLFVARLSLFSARCHRAIARRRWRWRRRWTCLSRWRLRWRTKPSLSENFAWMSLLTLTWLTSSAYSTCRIMRRRMRTPILSSLSTFW